MIITAIIVLFIATGVLLWGLVRGAALCLSPAERAERDDEQERILAALGTASVL